MGSDHHLHSLDTDFRFGIRVRDCYCWNDVIAIGIAQELQEGSCRNCKSTSEKRRMGWIWQLVSRSRYQMIWGGRYPYLGRQSTGNPIPHK